MIQRNQKKKSLLPLAKTLRRNMTRQEKRLWYDFLQRYPVKIYKQKIIDRFIVDFYCHQAKLVIEIDGSQHFSTQGERQDEERTSVLNANGLTVLRFSNLDVAKNFEGVCTFIDQTIQSRILNYPPSHPLSRELSLRASLF